MNTISRRLQKLERSFALRRGNRDERGALARFAMRSMTAPNNGAQSTRPRYY
jgi:hypothetical protein